MNSARANELPLRGRERNGCSSHMLPESRPAADRLAGRHLADPGIDPGTRLFQNFIRKRRIVDRPGEDHCPTIAAQLPIAARRLSAGSNSGSAVLIRSICERRPPVMAERAAAV